MPDINFKLTADSSELKKEAQKSSKLIKRMEKGHEKSLKKRTILESKSFEKIDKVRSKSTKNAIKDNKLLERETKKRLDNEVKAEKEAAAKKAAAREKFKGFALAAGGQAFGALGAGQLGAGLALAGQGGAMGLGVGVGIAAVGAIANVVRGLVGFKDEMIRFGIATRMTNKDLDAYTQQIGVISTTTGYGRIEMLDSLKGIFETTRTVPALDQLELLAKTLKVSGEGPSEFTANIEKIGTALKTTNFEKIFRAYQILTTSGNVGQGVEALNILPQLKKTEDNISSLSNLMRLKTFKDFDSFKLMNDAFKKEGINLFTGRDGKNLKDFDKIIKDINDKIKVYKDSHKALPEILQGMGDVNTFKTIKGFDGAVEDINANLKKLDDSPLTAFKRIQGLFEIIVEGTAMKGLEAMSKGLNEFLGDKERMDDFAESVNNIAKAFGVMAKAIGFAEKAMNAFTPTAEATAVIDRVARGEIVDPDIVTSPSVKAYLNYANKVNKDANVKKKMQKDWSRRHGDYGNYEKYLTGILNPKPEYENLDIPGSTTDVTDPRNFSITNNIIMNKDSVSVDTFDGRGNKIDTTTTVLER